MRSTRARRARRRGGDSPGDAVRTGRVAPQVRRRDGRARAQRGGAAPRSVRGVTIQDWSQEHAAYFRAIRIEKTMMSLILLLVVAVAAFNIVAALVMVVNEKRSDIAILRTLGSTRRGVVGVFLTQGLVIGAVGTLLGARARRARIADNVGTIVPVLERVFGFHVMDPTVYYITAIPSELRIGADRRRSRAIAFMLTVAGDDLPGLARCGDRTRRSAALRMSGPCRSNCGSAGATCARPATASCRSSR